MCSILLFKRGMNMTNALKDVYNEEFIIHLAKTVQQFYDRFDGDAFINLVFSDNWTEKTLKGRMRHVTTCLNAFLPHEYEDAIIHPTESCTESFKPYPGIHCFP